MKLPFSQAPRHLCILRLSAVGDICHTLPVVRSIQEHWPETKITWIIGKLEATLVGDIQGIEFVEFDKSKGYSELLKLRKTLKDTVFDALLHMQMSLRSSMAAYMIKTDIRLGFDKQRANDFQWLFTNHKIPYQEKQHVLDSLFGFAEAIGVSHRSLCWNIPIPVQDKQYAQSLLGDYAKNYAVISPCSSMSYRNWNAAGYAQVCDYLYEKHDLTCVISGGPSEIEQQYASDINTQTNSPILNLVGKTTLKQLLSILQSAKLVVAPDSGPAHMATTVHTPVIGLYACTNPDRARPYLSADYVVDRYHEAVLAKHEVSANQLPWGIRVRDSGTMDRISVNDVIEKIDFVLDGR